MSETLSMHLNLLETLLVAMQTIFRPYFHDPVEFDRIGSLFEFWCAQSKFQSERSALRSGSPAITKPPPKKISRWNLMGKADSYTRRTRNCPLKSADTTFMILGVWHRMAADVYIRSHYITVQNICKAISRLKWIETGWMLYKEEVITFICRKHCPCT